MAQKRLGQLDGGRTTYDLRTGEVMEEGFVAYVAPKRKNGFGLRWIAMAQDAAMLIAKSDLTGEDSKVLWALIAMLDFENHLVLSQAELARELDMHRQAIQRGIKRLLAMGVLLEGPKVGVNRSYKLNPNFGWKGSAKNHVIALDKVRQSRMKSARISGVVEGGRTEEL